MMTPVPCCNIDAQVRDSRRRRRRERRCFTRVQDIPTAHAGKVEQSRHRLRSLKLMHDTKGQRKRGSWRWQTAPGRGFTKYNKEESWAWQRYLLLHRNARNSIFGRKCCHVHPDVAARPHSWPCNAQDATPATTGCNTRNNRTQHPQGPGH